MRTLPLRQHVRGATFDFSSASRLETVHSLPMRKIIDQQSFTTTASCWNTSPESS